MAWRLRCCADTPLPIGRWLVAVMLCLAPLGSAAAAGDAGDETLAADARLAQLVASERQAAGLVGLGAVALHRGQTVGPVVSGERKRNSAIALTVEDSWHIGSVAKSFTATLIARLVAAGSLNWDTTPAEIFNSAPNIHPGWRQVTLTHLLTHSAGAPANFPFWTNLKQPAEGLPRLSARATAVKKVLEQAPESEPGSRFNYSNVGYTIAAVMAETRTGLPWETLMAEQVFAPLALASAGFGQPETGRQKPSQPLGHFDLLGFKLPTPPHRDNSPIIWPAGGIHMSLSDLARFGNDHLRGDQGRKALLQPTAYRHLHSPQKQNYAFGWVSTKLEGAAGEVFWHNGSNRSWYTLLVCMPDLATVIAVAANDGDMKQAEAAAWRIVNTMAEFLPGGAKPGEPNPSEPGVASRKTGEWRLH